MLSVNRLAGNPVWAAWLPPELIWAYLLLGVALIAGGAVVVWAARRYRWPGADNLTPEEQLARFRALKDQGGLDPEEFERIRALLEQGAPPDDGGKKAEDGRKPDNTPE